MDDQFETEVKLPDLFYESIRMYAKEVHGWDAKDLLQEIDRYIQAGDPLPTELRIYFHKAIEANDLNKSFGIKQSRVTGEYKRLLRDGAIYNAVTASDLGRHYEPGGAFEEVGRQFDMSSQNAGKIFYDFCDRHDIETILKN
jgi:hypothetical protein